MNDNFWQFLRKREYIYWKGFCIKDRNIGIYETESIINQYGFIVDFQMFSDIEIGIKIEIEELKIFKLYTNLKMVIDLCDYTDLNSESNIERTILLNVTFLKSTGNMKIEGPIGPG
jgi:hypothetical protein